MKTKVALFVNGWNCENVDNFIDGFNSFFSKDTVDLFVFTSYSLTVNDEKMIEAEDSIYSLADISFFDAAIVFGSGINSEEVVLKIRRKCEKAGVPIIFQGIEAEGITTVTVDNYIGMKKLCEHLIEKHGVNDVTFIAGPKDNADSNLRIKAVRETLESYGYSLKDESIYYASWEPTLIRDYLIENYRDMRMKLPDAFVCANDYMALMVIHFLDELGYKIPDDVIVSGFDNVSDGRVCYPSLATVNQNYQEQGRECAKLILEVIADKKMIKKSIIPCVGMPGESCGCSECNDETQMRKEYARVWCAEQYFWDNFQGRESELDICIMSTGIFENIQQSINEEFFSQICQETEDFHIYLNPQYKNLDYMDDTKVIYREPSFGPIMDVICARADGFVHCENTVNIKKLLLGYDGNATGKTYVFKSLKIGSTAIGYMAMGYKAGAFKRQEYLKFSNSLNKTFKKYQRNIDDNNKAIRIQEQAYEFLRQTVEALATAVDAKDSYTNGHSKRVAKYARKIAEEVGMTVKECDDVYLAGLLHDVGKIGIDDSIINKKGKLTDEEFAVIKLHPALGGQILSKIEISPSLSVGARYHHERYDGHGYPDNLKGTDIPQIARIISVADAYDAMTSNRSYRNQIPQQIVREEIIKGIGTQFDPIFAKIMVHLIDKDIEFQMQERIDFSDDTENTKLSCEEFRTNFAEAVRINEMKTKIHFKYENTAGENSMPAFVLFDSLDARVHKGDEYEKSLSYHEYGELRINGEHVFGGVRKTQTKFVKVVVSNS